MSPKRCQKLTSTLPYLPGPHQRYRRTSAASLILPGFLGSASSTHWQTSSRIMMITKTVNITAKLCEGKNLGSSATLRAVHTAVSQPSFFFLSPPCICVCMGGICMCKIYICVCPHACGGQKVISGVFPHSLPTLDIEATPLAEHRGRCCG